MVNLSLQLDDFWTRSSSMDLTTPKSSDKKFLRLSSSPASSPRIIPAPTSPTRSIHIERHSKQSFDSSIPMATKTTQNDADFFDDASSLNSEEAGVGLYSPVLADVNVSNRRSKFEPNQGQRPISGISGTSSQALSSTHIVPSRIVPPRPAPPAVEDTLPPGFMKLTQTPMQSPGMEGFLGTDGGPTSDANTTHEQTQPTEKTARFADWETGLPHTTEPYIEFEPTESYIPPLPVSLSEAAVAAALNNATREQQILGVHTITMQALLGDAEGLVATSLRNSEALDHSASDLPFRINPVTGRVMKRVNVVPPPIDVHSKNYVPEDIVRTPYPVGLRGRKEYKKMPSPLAVEFSIESPADVRVAVVLQTRSRSREYQRPRRTAYVVLPPHVEISRNTIHVASPGTKEKHFDSLDFDDTRLFKELSKAYARLVGPWRFFGARSLRFIRVDAGRMLSSGCNCICSDQQGRSLANYCDSRPHCHTRSGSCSHNATQASSPTSPTAAPTHNGCDSHDHHHNSCTHPLAQQTSMIDLETTPSNILTLYRNPKLGKSRYTWVSWIHKLANPLSSDRILSPQTQKRRPTGPIPPPLPEKPADVKVSVWEKRNSFSRFTDKKRTWMSSHSKASRTKRAKESDNIDPPGFDRDNGITTPTLTLIFVHGWSIPRILSAITLVLCLSILAALLWIFLGTSFLGDGVLHTLAGNTGFRGAGARVGEGMLVGGLCLGVGWSIVAGWIGISYAVG